MSDDKRQKWKLAGAGICWTIAIALVWQDESSRIPFFLRWPLTAALLSLAPWLAWESIKVSADEIFGKRPALYGSERPKRHYLAGAVLIGCALVNVVAFTSCGYQFAMQTRQAPPDVLKDLETAKSKASHFEEAWNEAIGERNDGRQLYARESEGWKAERARLQEENAVLARDLEDKARSLVEAVNIVDDRKQREALRDKLSAWMVRIETFRKTLKRERDAPVPLDEFTLLRDELNAFGAAHLRPAQLTLLNSTAAVTYPLDYVAIQNDDTRLLWITAFRWEVRLQQFMEETY